MKISQDQFQKIVYWTYQAYLNAVHDTPKHQQTAVQNLMSSYLLAVSHRRVFVEMDKTSFHAVSVENPGIWHYLSHMTPNYIETKNTCQSFINDDNDRIEIEDIIDTYNTIFGTDHFYILDYHPSVAPHFLKMGIENIFVLTMVMLLVAYGMLTPLLWGAVLAAAILISSHYIRRSMPSGELMFPPEFTLMTFNWFGQFCSYGIPGLGLLAVGPSALGAVAGFDATWKITGDLVLCKSTFFNLPPRITEERERVINELSF
ncbi:MAG: hypothetical protein CK424_00995 [Legionella sp.]|nr:MAG: hypothetical protein CK424_00995 [Legionella sp.]